MAKTRTASAIQSKIQMILFGDPFTGKSTLASQLAYMKNPDGTPFKVLYLDPESGSIDDYIGDIEANGVDPQNILIVYTQSLAEVLEYIRKATNNDDFYQTDEDGNETDDVILDGSGKPFRPDAIVVDGATVLNLTTKQGLVEFSKKRAQVKADAAGLIGDARLVKIDGAGMELKDYNTVNFKGQDLILSLNASGKHYIVTARETDEKVHKEINGKAENVATGKKIPDGFKEMDHNAKTCIRMYRDSDDYGTVKAFIVKDRTNVHKAGEIIEDPSLIDWQAVIDRTANKSNVVIKNSLARAVQTEKDKYAAELGAQEEDTSNGNDSSANAATVEGLRKEINDYLKGISDPRKKKEAQDAVVKAGLPKPRATESIDELNKILEVLKLHAES